MMNYAGFWLRFVAAVVDGVILSIVNWFVRLILGEGLATALVSIIIAWGYFASLESSARQATLGKSALGLKVTDKYGRQLSFGRATGRHFSKYISGVLLLIGYIMIGFTKRKQGLHDLIAGTLVVKSGRIPAGDSTRNF